jgi:thioredoxin
MIQQLNKHSFKLKVFNFEKHTRWHFEGDKPCIIDFYADWCGPCKKIEPILEELHDAYAGKIDVYKIDTVKEKELATMFQVHGIPSLMFVPLNGKPKTTMGAWPRERLEDTVKNMFEMESG